MPPKVNGTATYGIDVRLPDMLYASVMTCPVFGGKLKSYNFDAIKSMPGVKAAVEIPNGLAVVADSFWRAKTALEVMPIEWDLGAHANVSSAELQKMFRTALDKDGVVANEKGDALAALKSAAKVVEADYEVTYLAHATMEPMNCTAQVTPERVDVWLGTQNPEGSLAAAAEVTGMAPENVYVHTCFLGGGFGRRSYGDDVRQAVTIAKAMAGKPVKMIWTREEDMRHDFYRPMAAFRFRAGLDANGGARSGALKTPLPSKVLWMNWRMRRGKIPWSFGACSSRTVRTGSSCSTPWPRRPTGGSNCQRALPRAWPSSKAMVQSWARSPKSR